MKDRAGGKHPFGNLAFDTCFKCNVHSGTASEFRNTYFFSKRGDRMKRVGDFRILEPKDADFSIDESFATALGIREGSVLYGISLTHAAAHKETSETSSDRDVENRLMTLIVTPFPRTSWSRLVRMSVTLDPKPGSLFELVSALNNMKLFTRHVEDVTGTTLSGVSTYRPAFADDTDTQDRALLPSATFVLEIPSPGEAGHTDELHAALTDVLHDARTSSAAIPKFQARLRELCAREISIQWISPMATLNKLSQEKVRVEKIGVVRSALTGKLQVSLLPWQRQLWRSDLALPFREHPADRKDLILAMASLDSDEKVIAWYFYEYDKRLVVQFEMTTPAYGMEHVWFEYIYGCVKDAGGSVLGSSSSARIDGSWGTLRCTAMFPLTESATTSKEIENVKSIVHCFRKLQGNRSSTQEFKDHETRLARERDAIEPLLFSEDASRQRWSKKSLNSLSQLDQLIVWDPFAGSTVPRFSNLFAQNPFSFTTPLRLESYRKLYADLDSADKERTRRRLAGTIIDRLSQTPGENIALVGAHRAGKTTVLNLVYDLLAQRLEEEKKDSQPKLIPVRLYSPMTPPHLLFVAIMEEISKLGKEAPEEAATLAQSLRPHVSRFTQLAQAALHSTEFNLLGLLTFKPGDFVEKLDRGESSGTERLRSLLVKVNEERTEALPEFLRISLLSLRDALDAMESEGQFRLVVMMDEFSESWGWGDARTLSVWRQAIESSEFSRIKWLFSTTRPVKDAADYSPITNILYEVNVGSLRPEESERMIDAFSVTAWARDKETNGDGRLRPVITHPARRFLIHATSSLPYLLQVSCYHIYDRATRTDFPLINKALCRKVILTKVLPEIADYLERQWSQVPESAQRFILDSLPKRLRTPEEFLKEYYVWEIDDARMPPGSLKALDRSGLRGEDGRCVAPLVAAWLLSRDMR